MTPFFSTYRMTMIRCALDSPMSQDLPRYLQRCRRACRKFSRATWKKSYSSKHDVLSEYSNLTLSFIFQNLNFFEFSWHIFRLVRRMVTIFLLTQRTRFGGPFKYLEHVRKVHRKFSTSLWKKVLLQKMRFCQNILTRFQASFYKISTFFTFPGI